MNVLHTHNNLGTFKLVNWYKPVVLLGKTALASAIWPFNTRVKHSYKIKKKSTNETACKYRKYFATSIFRVNWAEFASRGTRQSGKVSKDSFVKSYLNVRAAKSWLHDFSYYLGLTT